MATSTHTVVYKIDSQTAAASRGVNTFTASMNRLNATVTKTRTITTGAGSGGITNGLNMLVSGVDKAGKVVVNNFMNMANAVRLTAQGFMTLGKSLTFALTPAALAILVGAGKAAIDFDDAMVRVSKTTGLVDDDLNKVTRGIRDLATHTSTSTNELARLAEQIGQTGVRDPEGIVELTDMFNKLVVTTEVTADDVALQIGRIAKAFSMDLNTEEGREQIWRLLNVFNELENRMEVTVPEIIEGMLNLAEVGSMLDFPPTVAASLVSALTALGMGAKEAGTSMRNFLTKVVQNADVVAELMKNTWGQVTAQDVLTKVNEDAAGVILQLIKAAAEGDQKAQSMFAAFEVGGIRAGRGWTVLAAGIETTTKALGISEQEWAEAMSLQVEYERALLSTKSQLNVMKNNLTEVALELGQVLLPIMNEAIQTVIPAIRDLADAISRMSTEQVISIVKWIAFAAAIGPAMLIISQLVFTVSMLAMAFGRVMGMAWAFLVLILKLAVNIGGLGKVFGVLRAGIGGLVAKGIPALLTGLRGIVLGIFTVKGALIAAAVAAAYLLLKFTGLGENIANFFLDLGARAADWGENLINTFAGGILAGAARVLSKVLTWIGNFIARFFAGHSPPEMGPLSHIDKWGKTLIDTYLGGMLEGDFSILNRVSSVIKGILTNFAKTNIIGEKDQFTMLLEARQNLAKLLSTFQKTGKISESVLSDVVKNLGEAKDEVAELLRRWIKYVDIQKQLEELERRRQKTLDGYEDEIELIGASNKSAEERVSMIRNAMRSRDQSLKQIAQEEKGLEAQKEEAKSQLDLQRELIDAMQKQDDIQIQLLDKIKQLTGSLKEGLEFPEITMPPFPEIDPKDLVGQVADRFLTLEERIQEAGKVWEGFKRGFLGQPLGVDLIPPITQEQVAADLAGGSDEPIFGNRNDIQKAYDQGARLGELWTTISTTLMEVKDNIAGVIDALDFTGIIEAVGSLGDRLLGTGEEAEKLDTPPDDSAWSKFSKGFGDNFSDALKEIQDFLGLDFDDFAKRFGDMWKFFLTSWGFVQEVLTIAREILNNLLEWLGIDAQLEEWDMTWEKFGEHVANAVAWILNILLAVVGGIVSFVGFIVGAIVWLAGLITAIFISIGTAVIVFIGVIIGAVAKFVKWVSEGNLTKWVQEASKKIGKWASELGPKLANWFSEAGKTIGAKIKEWATIAGEKLEEVRKKVAMKFLLMKNRINITMTNIKAAIKKKWDEIKTSVTTKLDEIKKLFSPTKLWKSGVDLIQGLWNGIKFKIQQLISWLEGKIQEILGLFNKIPESESPSKKTTESGKWVGQGFNMGIQEELNMTPALVGDSLNTTLSAFGGFTPGFSESNIVSNNQQPITLVFERDSVRSDDDIEAIAEEVERIIDKKSRAYSEFGVR